MFFAALGSLAGFLFFFIDSSSATWSLSAILAIVANVALGASGVCLNSFVSVITFTQMKISYLIDMSAPDPQLGQNHSQGSRRQKRPDSGPSINN